MPAPAPISTQLTLAALGDNQGWELLTLEEDRKGNRCTAACLDARLELREAILRALSKGHGTESTSKTYGVSREVVRALKRNTLENGELDACKQQLAREAAHAVDLLVDRVKEEIDSIPRSSFAPLITSLTNASQILSGGPTSRVAYTKEGVSVSDVAAFIDALPRVQPVVAGEETAPISAPALEAGSEAGAVVDLAPAGERSAGQSGDSLSPVLRATIEENAA